MSRPLSSRTEFSSAPVECSPEGHAFVPPKLSDSRSPCPALNALSNHGYIARDGRRIGFLDLICTLVYVYNISYPLAFFLTIVGFLNCGQISAPTRQHARAARGTSPLSIPHQILLMVLGILTFPFRLEWTLDLYSLTKRGPFSISHDASLVHDDEKPSTSPDPKLVESLIQFGIHAHGQDPGLTLADLAHLHYKRESALPHHRLSTFHEQIALGECGLAWAVLRTHDTQTVRNEHRQFAEQGSSVREESGLIPLSRVEQLFGEERLPDGWWGENGARPPLQIGLMEARRCAKDVAQLPWKALQ